MATPDDLEEFRSCQLTFRAGAAPWNDMSRGAEHWLDGPDEVARTLGMEAVLSAGMKNEDEGLYPMQHGYWLQVMREAVAREKGQDPASVYDATANGSRPSCATSPSSRVTTEA
jgi:benzoate/toluate 1,2-dioxygenase alpha subunit